MILEDQRFEDNDTVHYVSPTIIVNLPREVIVQGTPHTCEGIM